MKIVSIVPAFRTSGLQGLKAPFNAFVVGRPTLKVRFSKTATSNSIAEDWLKLGGALTLLIDAPRGYANVFLASHRIGVLLSGRGISRRADSIAAGRIPGAEIALVISNREGAPGLASAAARGIASKAIPSKGLAREEYDRIVVEELRKAGVEIVCLAGFMRLLSPYFVAAYPQRILNIHPTFLAVFSRVGISAAGARIWREICRLHGAFCG